VESVRTDTSGLSRPAQGELGSNPRSVDFMGTHVPRLARLICTQTGRVRFSSFPPMFSLVVIVQVRFEQRR